MLSRILWPIQVKSWIRKERYNINKEYLRRTRRDEIDGCRLYVGRRVGTRESKWDCCSFALDLLYALLS